MTGARHTRRPTREVTQPVRLTTEERARCEALVRLYGGSISDVLRAGIGALEREHAAELAEDVPEDRPALHKCGLPGERGESCTGCEALESSPGK